MAPKVDTGEIVAVRRFAVEPDDDVGTLLRRAYDAQAALFEHIVTGIARGEPLPESRERWARRPTTRRELDALFEIRSDMDACEVARRVRATTYGPYRARVTLHGFVFELVTPHPGCPREQKSPAEALSATQPL
jgi:methionyl-tRNA formyltransferase